MGAIIRLNSMPSKCRECPFADDDVIRCRIRNTRIIAGKKRKSRMPLCPLRNEEEYLSSLSKKYNLKFKGKIDRGGQMIVQKGDKRG